MRRQRLNVEWGPVTGYVQVDRGSGAISNRVELEKPLHAPSTKLLGLCRFLNLGP